MAKALALTAGMLAAGLTGCFGGAAAFTCEQDLECNAGTGGRCELNHFCSYADEAKCGPAGQVYGENSGGLSGKCVGQEPRPDGGVDSQPSEVCYGASNGLVKPCFSSAPTGEIVLPTALDTDTSTLCVTPKSGGTGYCVIAASSIRVDDTVAATGSKPLVLVATNSITIGATLDVASHHTPTQKTGAGAGSTDCTAGTLPVTGAGGGGGAGGSFAGAGGNGGNGGNGGTSGKSGAVQVATTLRGGCPGQNGINGTFGTGGKGGGAVYLIANTAIMISGAINASGEGGHPGTTGSAGGGGGGSGGMIGLDAPTIDNTGVVFANGASGGEGSGTATAGNIGPEPTSAAPSSAPLSGTTNGGDGGGGSAGGTDGGNATGGNGQGGSNNPSAGGGGGGGGGAGVIKVYRGTLTGKYSPNPTP